MTNAETAKIFKAFSDERRLEILTRLQHGESSASELIEQLNIGQSTLSHHMRILCESGVVSIRREGTFAYYSISIEGSNHVKEILNAITKIQGYRNREREETNDKR